MDLQTIGTLIEFLQESCCKVMSAQNFYTAYRRTAGEHGIPSPVRPEFPALVRVLTETAKELDRRREAVQSALYGTGILQAEIISPDGTRKRTVVIARPTKKLTEPHVTRAAYLALVTMLGGEPLTTAAPFDIAVADESGRATGQRIKAAEAK